MNGAPGTRLAILLWATSPERPETCAAPFVYAVAAAALDCEVEIHFSARAVRLLVQGVAGTLYPGATRERTVLEFMRDASDHGVRLLGCHMAMREHIAPGEALIAEFGGYAGATAFVQRAVDPGWRTLVF